jgi:hypothetical protein
LLCCCRSRDYGGVGLPFPFWRKGYSQSQSLACNAVMLSRASPNILVHPPTHYCMFFARVIRLSLSLQASFLRFYNSHSHGPLNSGSYIPWPTHQPPLLARMISQPTAAGTIALEEAEEETEHRAKARMQNNLRAATEMLAEAEAAVDAPEEGHQEGHQPPTNPAMRNLSPPPNNRSKQKERPWL